MKASLSVSIEIGVISKLSKIAEAENKRPSAIIEEIIMDYIEKHEQKTKETE